MRWTIKLLSLGAALLPLAFTSACAEVVSKSDLTARHCETAPVIDGNLDDPCWSDARWTSDFRVLHARDASPSTKTSFAFVHDGQTLFFAARMAEPQPGSIKSETTERDGPVFRDDSVEVMITANGDRTSYAHFVVNSAGALFDAGRRQGGAVSDQTWDAAGARAAAKIGEDQWTVELAVPLAELDLDAHSLGPWFVNVGRSRHAGGVQELVSATGDFHNSGSFLPLRLANAGFEAFLWDVKPPFAVRTTERDGRITWTAKTVIANHTGDYRATRIDARLDNGAGEQNLSAAMDDGSDREISLAVSADSNGPSKLTLTITDRNTGDVLAVRQFPVQVNYTPLEIDLTRPWYRDNIYATEKIDALVGVVRTELSEDALEGASLHIAFRRGGQDEVGDTLAEISLQPLAREADFRLPLPDKLSDGLYTLTSEIRNKDGQVLHAIAKPIRKLPPHPNEVRLDEHGVTRINGSPFFPFGWYSIHTSQWKDAVAQGYNVHFEYSASFYFSESELQDFFDQAADAGIKIALYPYPEKAMVLKERAGLPLDAQDTERIRAFVGRWKDHPALLGWMLADEPELVPFLPERLEQVARLCADEDPYHPTFMLNDTIAGITKYARAGDIFDPDPYPLFVKDGLAAQPIGKVGEFIENVLAATGGRRGAWVVPQGFNYGDFGRTNNREPNFVELRNMAWQAIIARATGFVWYTWYAGQTYPDMMEAIRYLREETRALEPAILAPQTDQPMETASEFLRATYRKVGETEYLLAVNVDTEAIDAKIPLPQDAAVKWYAVGEDRTVDVKDGTLADAFDTYGTHLYTNDPSLAKSVSLAKAQEAIERIRSESPREGNLAQQPGVGFSTDSNRREKAPLSHVANGARDGLGWTPNSPAKGRWLEVAFPKPVTAGRIELFSKDLKSADLQVWRNDRWETLGSFEPADGRFVLQIDPVQSAKLRVVIKEAAPWVTISEIEIYNQ